MSFPVHMAKLSWCYVVFESGKVIATGFKCMSSPPIAQNHMVKTLSSFRKGLHLSIERVRQFHRDAETLHRLKSENKQDKSSSDSKCTSRVISKTTSIAKKQRLLGGELKAQMKELTPAAIASLTNELNDY
jgi:hypothetical protein